VAVAAALLRVDTGRTTSERRQRMGMGAERKAPSLAHESDLCDAEWGWASVLRDVGMTLKTVAVEKKRGRGLGVSGESSCRGGKARDRLERRMGM
jgi:hypothetical protein